MVLNNNNEAIQRTRDELSSEPNIQPIYKIKTERLLVEESASKTFKNVVGHSFILGHEDNGVLGNPALGDDGSQVVLGEAGRSVTLLRITNPNNTFKERFNFTTFEDSSNTTADWAGTLGTLSMTTGEEAWSDTIAKESTNFVSAKISIFLSSGSLGDLTFYLSANGGSDWEVVSHDVLYSFVNQGTDLRFKIVSADTVVVSGVFVKYNLA